MKSVNINILFPPLPPPIIQHPLQFNLKISWVIYHHHYCCCKNLPRNAFESTLLRWRGFAGSEKKSSLSLFNFRWKRLSNLIKVKFCCWSAGIKPLHVTAIEGTDSRLPLNGKVFLFPCRWLAKLFKRVMFNIWELFSVKVIFSPCFKGFLWKEQTWCWTF